MSEHKYPYIPKPYHAATMFACKMIRDNGYFNKAINVAAKYYDVDSDELEKHVRARQGAGQKGKKRGTYKYYRFKGHYSWVYGESTDIPDKPFDVTVKALNRDNAWKSAFTKILPGFDWYIDNCSFDFEINGDEVQHG